MEYLITFLYICICVALFSLAVIIHEFGHFIVALKLGLKVEAFSLGFGPVLYHRKVRGVDYRLSLFPLGGYVSLPEVDLEGAKTGHIAPWKEIAVAFAGPGMNIVLAVALAVGLSLVPSARFGELPATIGEVIEGGPAAQAGLAAGDTVLAVGGRPIASWSELMTEVQIAGGKATEFTVAADDGAAPRTLSITPARNEVTGAWYIMAISVTNASGAVSWMPSRNPLRQLAWDAGSIFRVLKGLVTPREAKATSQALGGPVMIAEALYRQVRRNPWDALGFLRFLNSNLAILNLLPIPVLDGSIILFAFLALVFRRRLPDFIIRYLSLAFMVALMGVMGLLIIRDSLRSWRIHTYEPGQVDVQSK